MDIDDQMSVTMIVKKILLNIKKFVVQFVN